MLEVYTDGSADIRNGSGAWAYAIIDPATDKVVSSCSGYAVDTTNNRMEISAAIEALKAVDPNQQIRVISDSAYLVNCMNQKWYVKWMANHWYSTTGKVKNIDLWVELLKQTRRFKQLQWQHVRGHSGNKWNEYVDKMCDQMRRQGMVENL